MTPLIDVVFLLIVFFVLVSRIVDEDRPQLDLPSPQPAATRVPAPAPRATVSEVGSPASGWRYRVSGADIAADEAGRIALERHLEGVLAHQPRAAVQVRAGRATPWDVVAPVLDGARAAARRAGVAPVRVQLATVRSAAP